MSKLKSLKRIIGLYTFILVTWGLYRYLFKLPDEVEEIVLKPLLWIIPTIILVKRSKEKLSSLGWSTQNLFKSIYLGIGLGMVFAVEGFLANNLKYGGTELIAVSLNTPLLLWTSLLVSLVTAVSEETVFRGYIFSRLWQLTKNEFLANIISSIGWSLIHFPLTIFVLHYSPSQMLAYFILTFIFGSASSLIFARTGTIVAPVLLHVFWSWPINLFR